MHELENVDHPCFRKLNACAEEALKQFPDPYLPGLQAIGLTVFPQLAPPDTDYGHPINSAQFACTGVDGTTFLLLGSGGEFHERAPIAVSSSLLTAIVAETLTDFLRLGSIRGFWLMDSFIHAPADALKLHGDAQWRPTLNIADSAISLDDRGQLILKYLIDYFSLRPLMYSDSEFQALQHQAQFCRK